jgi:hypothetical protein
MPPEGMLRLFHVQKEGTEMNDARSVCVAELNASSILECFGHAEHSSTNISFRSDRLTRVQKKVAGE